MKTATSIGHLKTAWQQLFLKQLPLQVESCLISAYKQPHRHYHRLPHINDFVAKIMQNKHLFSRFEDALVAAWFHDAVYHPGDPDNEEKSAELFGRAAESMITPDLSDQQREQIECLILRIKHLIILTKHHEASTNDEKAFVDIDLSVLAAPEKKYSQYESNIRKEYARWSEFEYQKGRRSFLLKIASRPDIFLHPTLRIAWEHKASQNINWSLYQQVPEVG